MAPTVGAERSGRTAVSHRQEKLVDLHLARLLRIFLRRKQAGQQSFPVLLPQTFYNNSTLIKLLDIEMTRRQSTDKDVSLNGFKISENDYGARSVEMKRRSALFETAQRSILDQVT